jgi:hypothetical protein
LPAAEPCPILVLLPRSITHIEADLRKKINVDNSAEPFHGIPNYLPALPKKFRFPSDLQRHLRRRTPCELVVETSRERGGRQCPFCHRLYASSSALSHHVANACKARPAARGQVTEIAEVKDQLQKLAVLVEEHLVVSRSSDRPAASATNIQNMANAQLVVNNAPVAMIQNVTNIQNTTNVQNNILCLGVPPALLAPGWPVKWPPPAVAPNSFRPLSFTITLDVLRRAIASSEKDAGACLRGEPAAVAGLLVEIVKLVHADPLERNIFLSPNRADQVLVYVPERWELITLLEGIRRILSHVAAELASALPLMGAQCRELASCAQKGFRDQEGEVVKSSRGAMTAHLENMRVRALNSGCWLGELSGAQGVERPRKFGGEFLAAFVRSGLQFKPAPTYG